MFSDFMNIQRGDILLVDLEPKKGSEIGKIRPCVVIQNDQGNRFSPTTIVAAITSKRLDKDYPTNVFLSKQISGLDEDSVVLCSQIYVISIEHRVIKKLSFLNNEVMLKVNEALKESFGF